MHPVNIFVSHSFSDIHHEAGVAGFRKLLSEALSCAHRRLNPAFRDAVNLEVFFDTRSYGTEINSAILARLRVADIIIADITGGKENVLYEIGYAHALGAQLLLLKNRDLETDALNELRELIAASGRKKHLSNGAAFGLQYCSRPMAPADLGGMLIASYKSPSELPIMLEARLNEVLEGIAHDVVQGVQIFRPKSFWFPASIRTIHIICSPEPEVTRGAFANKASDNYISIDGIEDRDSVLELGMYLSRSYPDAEVCIHSSNDLGANLEKENLVIVGGPLHNMQARQFMKRLNVPIEYNLSPDDEVADFMRGTDIHKTLRVIRDENGLVLNDIGYFGWFRNPLKRENRVVMCQGYQTWGTVAATRVLADTTTGRRNRTYLMGKMRDLHFSSFDRMSSIQAFFNVDVMEDRKPETPILSDSTPALLFNTET